MKAEATHMNSPEPPLYSVHYRCLTMEVTKVEGERKEQTVMVGSDDNGRASVFGERVRVRVSIALSLSIVRNAIWDK